MTKSCEKKISELVHHADGVYDGNPDDPRFEADIIFADELRETSLDMVKNCKNDNPSSYSKWVCGKTVGSDGKIWRCIACLRFIDFFEMTVEELK